MTETLPVGKVMEKNKEEKPSKNKIEKGYDIAHKEQVPEIPKPVIDPPKEATDPSETIKRA